MFDALMVNKDEDTGKTHAEVTQIDLDRLPEGDVTVAVEYSTVNYKDGLCIGPGGGLVRKYPHIPGIDFAGTVEASDDDRYKPGDKVVLTGWRVGEAHWGGYAQKARVKADWLVPLPEGLDTRQAMAVGTAGFTAMLSVMALEDHGLVPGNGPVLVTGAAGGVGSIMVQLLKQRTKLNIIASASRAETISWLEDLGADTIVNHRNPLSEEFAAKNLSEVDYVVSLNNTEQHLPEIEKVVKPQGQFALIDDPETLNIVPFKNKSVSVHWELMFTRSLFKTDDMQEQHVILNNVATMIDQGQIKTTVGEHLGKINAANLRKAHQHLESQTAKGKVVLEGF